MSRIDRVLATARGRLRRLTADQVPDALRRGAVLVDIRPQAQRASEGEVRGALVIERNVLEWRCDPTSEARLPQAEGDDVEWVILCSQGYTSSLAAAALLDLGLHRATDVIGGYHALAAAGVLADLRLQFPTFSASWPPPFAGPTPPLGGIHPPGPAWL
jgi:rhodanese-related sulfurtransferase